MQSLISPVAMCLGSSPLSTAPAGDVLGRGAPGRVSPTLISPRDPFGAGPGHSGL